MTDDTKYITVGVRLTKLEHDKLEDAKRRLAKATGMNVTTSDVLRHALSELPSSGQKTQDS